MSEKTDRDFLEHIREAAERASSYTEKMNSEEFLRDTKTQDAVIRNIEIIGEATKNLSDDLRDRHPEIPWKGLAGMRDRLIHQYFGVNLDVVWSVAKDELPEILLHIKKMKETE
ncbi:HepT-like ribonuclease domain-containing protein [Desulfonema magnum]|uniref:DUF86 n=1 Tax=Desulfonema magnum TaxID=45655 RepID=A0A975GRX9_9BACT|nr:DUF86 domain-containing protein [Desulfonema magnum]QTA91362.1 DUF86 [Desulfonema magnum]